MNCHHARQLISPYLDHQVSGREMLALQDHLAVCVSCDRERQSLRQVKLLLRGLSEPHVPPGFSRNFSETIALRLAQPITGPGRQALLLRPQRGRRLTTALALSCLTIVSFAAPFAPEAHEALRASAALASGGPAFPGPSSTDALLSGQPADHLLLVSPGTSPSGFTVPPGDALTLADTETPGFGLRPQEASLSSGQFAVFRPR